MSYEPDKLRALLSMAIVFGFFGLVAAMMILPMFSRTIDPTVWAVITTLTGVLAGEFKGVYNFYFATSSGQRATTAALINATVKNGSGDTSQPSSTSQTTTPPKP